MASELFQIAQKHTGMPSFAQPVQKKFIEQIEREIHARPGGLGDQSAGQRTGKRAFDCMTEEAAHRRQGDGFQELSFFVSSGPFASEMAARYSSVTFLSPAVATDSHSLNFCDPRWLRSAGRCFSASGCKNHPTGRSVFPPSIFPMCSDLFI